MSKRSTRSTAREKESKIAKTRFPPLPASEAYKVLAVKTRLVKEEMVWYLTEILKSTRKKLVATELVTTYENLGGKDLLEDPVK